MHNSLSFYFLFQVYTSQRVEYSGGSFFGQESDAPTRTLLSFLIESMHGQYQDMVAMIPVVTLDWKILLSTFYKVFESLEEVGFRPVVVLGDGHKTNTKFFTELGDGVLKTQIPNPIHGLWPLFILYDPVHLMKNFYNNFERKRYTIVFFNCHSKGSFKRVRVIPNPNPYVATHNVVHNIVQLQPQLRYSYSSNLT